MNKFEWIMFCVGSGVSGFIIITGALYLIRELCIKLGWIDRCEY